MGSASGTPPLSGPVLPLPSPLELPEPLPGVVGLMVNVGVYVPLAAYVCVPETLKGTVPLISETVPALDVPSPQLIVAAKYSTALLTLKLV